MPASLRMHSPAMLAHWCAGAQVKAMKEGKSADKPIYNHVTGALDPPEKIESPSVSCAAGCNERHIATDVHLGKCVHGACTALATVVGCVGAWGASAVPGRSNSEGSR
eukprot:GHRQ01036506.1.p1 GENE.GHRQ01036506.1~~GHRQ01036506.1.p1  ORF type:complete len:108 (-),score=23.08 GHRQ01036506.1:322-645(-)